MRILAFFCIIFTAIPMVSYGQNAELDITEIVEAQAAYDAKQTNKTRSGLIAALSAYQGEPTIETVNAHLILMMNDATAGNDRKLHESAEAAATHLEPVASILPTKVAYLAPTLFRGARPTK